MIQSINLFRWNCLWKTFPSWNKTIDNTNSEPLKAFLRYTQGSNSEKKLLREDGSGAPQETKLRVSHLNIAVDLQTWRLFTPLIFSWEISHTKKMIYCQYIRHTEPIVSGIGRVMFELFIKRRHCLYQLQPFTECSGVMHFNTAIPLSLNVYHQFANEPIKRHGIHYAVVQTTTAKAFPIAVYSLLITAQLGLWRPGSVAPFCGSKQQLCIFALV